MRNCPQSEKIQLRHGWKENVLRAYVPIDQKILYSTGQKDDENVPNQLSNATTNPGDEKPGEKSYAPSVIRIGRLESQVISRENMIKNLSVPPSIRNEAAMIRKEISNIVKDSRFEKRCYRHQYGSRFLSHRGDLYIGKTVEALKELCIRNEKEHRPNWIGEPSRIRDICGSFLRVSSSLYCRKWWTYRSLLILRSWEVTKSIEEHVTLFYTLNRNIGDAFRVQI